MVGVPGVGKTSLIRRFVEGVFDESYLGTLGVVVSRREVVVNRGTVRLMVWDVEGVETGPPNQGYIRGSHGLLFVADGTDRHSFSRIVELQRQVPFTPACQVVLLNKVDQADTWSIVKSDLAEIRWADSIFETSAKNGASVAEAFEFVAEKLAQGGSNVAE